MRHILQKHHHHHHHHDQKQQHQYHRNQQQNHHAKSQQKYLAKISGKIIWQNYLAKSSSNKLFKK
jgi:hypothetical protein